MKLDLSHHIFRYILVEFFNLLKKACKVDEFLMLFGNVFQILGPLTLDDIKENFVASLTISTVGRDSRNLMELELFMLISSE